MIARLADVAPLSAEDALSLAVTGPCLRAAGVARDLRRDRPYLAYATLDFEVPIGSCGDDYDRLAVVVEEARQSVRMVDQCSAELASSGREEVASSGVGVNVRVASFI